MHLIEGVLFMDNNKYIDYLKMILDSDNISEEDKLKYLKMIQKIRLMNYNDTLMFEKKSYKVGDKYLNDKDMIKYELNYLNDDLKLSSLSDVEVRKIAYLLSKSTSSDDLDGIKKKITELQLKYGISPRFYSVFESVLEDVIAKEREKKLTDNNRRAKISR